MGTALEPIPNSGLKLRWHACAVVVNCEQHLTVSPPDGHFDFRSPVTNGVGDQVAQYLQNPIPIRPDSGRISHDADRPSTGASRDGVADQVRGSGLDSVELHVLKAVTGDVDEIGDNVAEVVRLSADGVQHLPAVVISE